jgi:hypothetical protein
MNATPESVLDVLVAEAERLLPTTYPPGAYEGIDWHAESWDYTQRGVKRTRSMGVHFVAHPMDGRNRFHPQFEYALKAYLVHAAPGSSKASSVVSGARALWSTLLDADVDPRTFRWAQVTQPVLDNVERRMLDHFGIAESSAVIYSTALDNFLEWLQAENVLPASLSLHRSLRLNTPRSLSVEDRQVREARLVAREVLDELARLYQTATAPRERLLICSVGILMVAGFRISELLTIPVDGLQHDIVDGREKWYIRYWQRKPGKGKRLEENKRWLSPMGSELVRMLWKEILAITAKARAAARHLEESADSGTGVRIPWVNDQAEYVSDRDVERAFGLASRHARTTTMGRHGIPRLRASDAGLPGSKGIYRRCEVEAALAQLQGPLLTHRSGKKEQRLSNTLLICFDQFMDPRKRASEVLVTRVATRALGNFLDGADRSSPLSGHLKTRTHAFRHWLNTVANKAGMSVFLISVWMQRANLEHTLAYLHDPLDIAEMAREGLRSKRFTGPGAEGVYGLADAQRDEQIDSIQLAHVAATVICTLDLTHAECPEQKFCEACNHGLYDPTNPQMQRALRARLSSLEANLVRLQRLEERGIPIHERQLEQAREAINTIRRRLASSLPVLSTTAVGN